MRNLLIAMLLLVGISNLNAQEWYSEDAHSGVVPGYVITEDGQKIEANMKFGTPWKLANGINFAHPDKQKEGKKEKFKYFKAGNFKEIGFGDFKFVYKRLPDFAKENLLVVVEGKASFFERYETMVEEGKEEQKVVKYVEVNGKLYPESDVRFLRFKKFAAKIFGDCPELKTRLANGEYRLNQLQEIVEEYNKLMN